VDILQQAFKTAMKIDKELLEKYHSKQCTAEESDAVEQWLFSGDSEEVLQLPAAECKAQHKLDIWKEIATVLPVEEKPAHSVSQLPAVATPLKRTLKTAFWSGAIAASLVTGIVATAAYKLLSDEYQAPELVNINNTSPQVIRHVSSGGYNITVGTNTFARIDNLTGAVDLSGSMLICPKKDVALSFNGSSKKVTFKKGQTYILLKGKDGADKILIVDKKNLMDLPPVLQKQIIHEFDI